MKPGARLLRARWGSALGLGLGVLAGCLHQEEEFVAEYAAEVCRIVRDCGRELHLPGEDETLPNNAFCEGRVEAHYSTCASGCEYLPAKARRCLRRLRDRDCDPNEGMLGDRSEDSIPLVCDEVFEQCEGGEDQDSLCASPLGCAVGGRPGEGWFLALGLVVLGLGARRRSRHGGGTSRDAFGRQAVMHIGGREHGETAGSRTPRGVAGQLERGGVRAA